MLKSKRFATGLDKVYNQIPIQDTSLLSTDYFRLFDIPERLYLGKNAFRIRANSNTLVKSSLIYIDIIDAAGKTVFHEVVNFIGEDDARLIVAHIYETTTPGEATIYIAGRASVDVRNGNELAYSRDASSSDFIDNPNLIWSKRIIIIPNIQNSTELIFASPPIVRATERRERYYAFDTDPRDRRKVVTGSFKLSTTSPGVEYKYSDTLKGAVRVSEIDENIIYDPKVGPNYFESSQDLISPFKDISVIYDAGGSFDEQYVGGTLVVKGLTNQLGLDKQTIVSLGGTVPAYSCSVLEVMDAKTAKVYPPFRFDYVRDGQTNSVKKFFDIQNVTASYYSTEDAQLSQVASESFVQLDFFNLQPIAGDADKVRISYKPFGSFGEFRDIGEYKIKTQDFLVSEQIDRTKIEFVEKSVGKFKTAAEFTQYWQYVNGSKKITPVNSVIFNNQGTALSASYTSSIVTDYDYYVRPYLSINAVENTEFKLTVTTNGAESLNSNTPQIDIFISGSDVVTNILNLKNVREPIKAPLLGSYLASVSEISTPESKKFEFYFRVGSTRAIRPVFAFRDCDIVNIKNITVQPRNERGYSPNQARLILPLSSFETNTELVLNIDYYTENGIKSRIFTQLYGVYFQGFGIRS